MDKEIILFVIGLLLFFSAMVYILFINATKTLDIIEAEEKHSKIRFFYYKYSKSMFFKNRKYKKKYLSKVKELKDKNSDIVISGNPILFTVASKIKSIRNGFEETVSFMEVDGHGVLVRVSTLDKNSYGNHALAESLAFIPNTKIGKDALDNLVIEKINNQDILN